MFPNGPRVKVLISGIAPLGGNGAIGKWYLVGVFGSLEVCPQRKPLNSGPFLILFDFVVLR